MVGSFLSPPVLKLPKGTAAVEGIHMLLILSPIVSSGGLIDSALAQLMYYSIKKGPVKGPLC